MNELNAPTQELIALAEAAARSVLQYMIEQGADVSSCDGRNLAPAGYSGDVSEVFKMLIAAHADFGVHGIMN